MFLKYLSTNRISHLSIFSIQLSTHSLYHLQDNWSSRVQVWIQTPSNSNQEAESESPCLQSTLVCYKALVQAQALSLVKKCVSCSFHVVSEGGALLFEIRLVGSQLNSWLSWLSDTSDRCDDVRVRCHKAPIVTIVKWDAEWEWGQAESAVTRVKQISWDYCGLLWVHGDLNVHSNIHYCHTRPSREQSAFKTD